MTQSTRPEVWIRPAIFTDDKEIVGQLFLAYARSLPISLDFQNFEHELAALPGKYASEKGGAVWLAYATIEQEPANTSKGQKEQAIGCIAIRPFFSTPTIAESATLLSNTTSPTTTTCELKRLYLTPTSRGLGVSKLLMDVAISHARKLGYKEMLLDTLSSMAPARKLYKGYGFEEISSYYESVEDAVFYRLVL
ncbi:GNAT family acetyltransferase [Pyrenophora tritici-repentis]|uniref:Acetyltransferase protein n=2 Tax=Pyrenophora tritici-repentis TaxID=45151 RepID=A0A2W1GQ19_9PLEO|nr:uncharacterized protein PTRG_05211 [Pyrenophora tritici-repentis Pt-1C-BFP]KAA8611623.1 GNAT family acetyltransferase [Pyrenophora tritici-repentis]EDU48118.1 conserved hypothetical protein [Pyrenophora tritici-repentis Pt-1C-BFP]KAF7447478.1 GNAT family acetyltransferase [Pyrenophora tritici-repentis]KAF7569853.1 putative GNAT family acetyltransferase [Pyrenophora tritici-repentis]KAG9382430.1 GNAT family acetyltransferase [Pyrenophora tritici-repentis]